MLLDIFKINSYKNAEKVKFKRFDEKSVIIEKSKNQIYDYCSKYCIGAMTS